ncbi:MAG: c-type cytochrome [Pseudomonadota bacterium]|nr:c-type cytochrome [Pseudomonadota bacterium]
MIRILGLTLILVLAIPATNSPLLAQDTAAGRALAVKHCGSCHAIGRTGDSPELRAPPFRVLMQRYKAEQLEEALAEGIVVGHPLMPEFVFEPVEISNLTGYFETLAPNRR